MKAIAAMAENRAIGRNNKLPWIPIKSDFKFFKEFTLNKILVIGSITFRELPTLPKRKILILNRRCAMPESFWDPIDDMVYRDATLDTILNVDKAHNGELICCGGAKTYELFLPYITEFYVTHVKGSFEADTFMPPFEHLFSKQEVVKEFDGHRVIKYSK